MSARKLWATRWDRIANGYTRFESKAAVYRYVAQQRLHWEAQMLRSQHLTVYVDERDGQGWQRYERIDLAEGGAS